MNFLKRKNFVEKADIKKSSVKPSVMSAFNEDIQKAIFVAFSILLLFTMVHTALPKNVLADASTKTTTSKGAKAKGTSDSDAKTAISSGANDSAVAIFELAKSCVPPFAVLAVIATAALLVIDHSPQSIQMKMKGFGIIVVALVLIWYSPTIIHWFIDVLEGAGGGTWESFSS